MTVDPESLPPGTAPNFTFHYIDIASVSNGRLSLPDAPIEYRSAPSRARRVVRIGDVLMSTVRPNLKAFAFCDLPPGAFVASTGFAVLRAKEGTDSRFILYSILSDRVSQQIERYVVGSNYPAINSSDVKRLQIPKFPLSEQRRIGGILATVDEAIKQTEDLIAKTQQVKAGVIHDLFTRGVMANGQLRPSREEAPHLYKETPLGWIPSEWGILKLRAGLLDNPANGIYKPASMIGSGTLLIGQTSVTEERSIDFSMARRAIVGADELGRYRLTEGDILVSRVFATVDGVGQPTLVPALPEPAVYESNMMRLRVDSSIVDSRLVFEWLRGHRGRRVIIAGASASNQTSINQRVLNQLPIPIQPHSEQEQLVSIIANLTERTTLERETLHKLRGLRAALMQDLLTGRVPV